MAFNSITEPIFVQVGDIIAYSKKEFSVVYLEKVSNIAVLFQRNNSVLTREEKPLLKLLDDLRMGYATVRPGHHDMIIPDTNNEIFRRRLAFIEDVEKEFGPSFEGLTGKCQKPILKEIRNKHGMKKTAMWKAIHLYLENGRDKAALYPKVNKERNLDPQKNYKRRGAKAKEPDLQSEVIVQNNPEILSIFEKYKSKIIKKHFIGPTAAYEEMLGEYFMRVVAYTDEDGLKHVDYVPLPRAVTPTFDQFYHWYINNTTYQERQQAKTDILDYRNNHRLLHSDTFSSLRGPGSLAEADHWEVPMYLKSKYSNDSLSHPVLSILFDDYYGAPITANISYDNNSNRALTSLMLSLSIPKKELCAKYDVHISDESEWPSCFIPEIIRVDGGQDFTSYKTLRFVQENQFELEPVSPKMGSFKPNVERFFRTLDTYLAGIFEGKGYVTNMHNSHPEEEACITIDELFHVILEFIVMYLRSPRTHFKRTKEMRDKNIRTTPLSIFEFGVKKYGAPKPIVNKTEYYWSLLMDDIPAHINREGLHFHDIMYIDIHNKELCDQMEACGKNKAPFSVRYDPRDISCVYYLKDGVLTPVPLKPVYESFKGLTLYELECYQKDENAYFRRAKYERTNQRAAARKSAKEHITTAVKPQAFLPGTSNIKENTLYERESIAKSQTVADRIKEQSNEKPVDCITDPLISVENPQIDVSHSIMDIRRNMDSQKR